LQVGGHFICEDVAELGEFLFPHASDHAQRVDAGIAGDKDAARINVLSSSR
jgi:hypothetical protein